MEAADRQPKDTPEDDDLSYYLWLPLALSGAGSVLGGAALLVATGLVRDFEKGELVLFLGFVGGVSLFWSWLVPNIRSEARLAWGAPPQRILAAMVRVIKGAVFGIVVGLVGCVLWIIYQMP